MKHFTFFAMALASVTLCSCHKTSEPAPTSVNPSKYVTDPAKRQMITSLEELDKDRFYLMNYTIDYKLQDVLNADAKNLQEVLATVSSLLLDEQPKAEGEANFSTGCSAYAATLEGTTDHLMGRNYDFCHMESDHEEPATAIVLFTAPEGGKKSINFVDAYWMRFHKGFYNDSTTDISALMFAPYIICDGMNEDGLAISVLHLDGHATEQNEEGKPNIYTSVAMRAVLDQFSTVDQAIEFLRGYNMHMATPANGSLHFMLADATGDYAIVEWSFSDDVLASVDANTVPTEFVVLKEDTNHYVTNFYNDPRLKDVIYGGLSNHGRDRYNTLRDTLQFYSYKLNAEQARTLLQAVAQDPHPDKPTSHTQWSNVYNLSQRTVECAILQEYDKWYQFTVTGKK